MKFIKRLILNWIIIAGIFWLLSNKIFPATFIISDGVFSYLLIATVFGISNSLIRPILNILTLPIRIITLGVSSIAVNALLLVGVTKFVNFLEINNIELKVTETTTYILASLCLTSTLFITNWITKQGK